MWACVVENMGKRQEQECIEYRQDLNQAQQRLEALVENGGAALSRYDIEIAHGGDVEQALWTALYLVGNHVRYFIEKVQECDRLPQQATLFELGRYRK